MNQLDLFGAAIEPVVQEAPPVARHPGALPDAAARDRIRQDLDTSLLVEAGAGAGKTTEMVRRMVALVATGRATVQQIAAVTFTRKAASELRERFQTALERALTGARTAHDDESAERYDRALRDIDRAFLGTIHAFCARLLRERPLEAGLDPGFRETLGSEERRQRREFWLTHLERLSNNGDPSLAELASIGVRPAQLYALFEKIAAQPDVEFPADERPRPEAAMLRRNVERIMDDAAHYIPTEEPASGWDDLQNTLRRLKFHRFVMGWTRDATFLDTIGSLTPNSFKPTQNRWLNGPAAKRIGGELAGLFGENGMATATLNAWWEYRYPIVLRFARAAERAYAQHRIRTGALNFQDLLLHAAELLRNSNAARRELGERYRYLLVDEFQDTDPVQAEVLFLLASEPRGTADATTWWHVTPRPGALFVVGDPKQSIYRFRRADMTLYAQVKSRFLEWGNSLGGVVELVSNFRSREPIEAFVNDNFIGRFPAEATETQARFAPMRVQPSTSTATTGVFRYEVGTPHDIVKNIGAEDAARLATWIADRIAAGERAAGDFLLLTPTTKRLAEYASALEARNVPVQVTGAGIVEKVELRELRLLLRALVDPGDPVLTLAVLVGLFFGLDYEQITLHVEECRSKNVGDAFSLTREWDEIDNAVTPALRALHRYWQWSRDLPADIAVAHIVDELGVLPFAAGGHLGETRAGALLFAIDAIRAAALAGDASMGGAIAALDAALEEDESEAPLEPGRSDVVRVMNLHKAKGLEARVVILAHPFGEYSPQPEIRIVRADTGVALGYVLVSERDRGSFGQATIIARPPDWNRHAEIENEFARAEDERLLYVAATRAAEELVIACLDHRLSRSPWRSFHPWLSQNATTITLPDARPGNRTTLQRSADDITDEIRNVDAARDRLRRATYRAASVTARKSEITGTSFRPRALTIRIPAAADSANDLTVHTPSDTQPDDTLAADRGSSVEPRLDGTAWGTVIHDALEHAARGVSRDRLSSIVRGLLISAERPVNDDGEPIELGEALQMIDGVVRSEIFTRARNAEQMLVEIPFAIHLTAAEYAAATGAARPDAAPTEIIDGRMDLLFRDSNGWTIVDYKSDEAGAAIPPDVMAGYRAQLGLYATAWERISGEPVSRSVLLFTADGTEVPASS